MGRTNQGVTKLRFVQAVAAASASALPAFAETGYEPNCIWIGATGSPTVTVNGSAVQFAGMVAGVWHPMPNFTHITSFGGATGVVVGTTE
jgi:hypothetical protein